MNKSMREFKDTAMAHMSREMKAGSRWRCACEACGEIRALLGMDKLLGVWPLVRALEQLLDEMDHMPDGPEKDACRTRSDVLYDQLAAEMAR
jgi:hypothetical protein